MSAKGHEHIVLACASGQLGGTELRMLEEGRALQDMGYRVTVATPAFGHGSRYQTLLAESGIAHAEFEPPAIMNNWRRRYVEYLRAQFASLELLRSARLVHIFMPWTNQGLDQLWQAYRSGVPTMLSIHNVFTRNHPLSHWYEKLLRRSMPCVRGVYGVSRQALNSFGEMFESFVAPGVRREVIYNFVDVDRFRPSASYREQVRKKLGVPEDVPLFGSVGRLDKQKRPLSLIATFQAIREAMPLARFLLIGQGHLENDVKRELQRSGMEEVTTVLPFQDDIEAYFPALDVHVLLSRNEGFGIVTAEALACGVPVVGTDVVGTQEVIGDSKAGRLVPLGDEAAAARAAMELYREREGLTSSAREHAESHFSKTIWQDGIEAFYAAMLESSNPA